MKRPYTRPNSQMKRNRINTRRFRLLWNTHYVFRLITNKLSQNLASFKEPGKAICYGKCTTFDVRRSSKQYCLAGFF